jgi:hypothetical protein
MRILRALAYEWRSLESFETLREANRVFMKRAVQLDPTFCAPLRARFLGRRVPLLLHCRPTVCSA